MFLKRKTHRSLAQQQVDVWIAWERRRAPFSNCLHEYESWARQFVEFISKQDVCDVGEEDIKAFLDEIDSDGMHGKWYTDGAESAIRSICRFYVARGKNMAKNLKT